MQMRIVGIARISRETPMTMGWCTRDAHAPGCFRTEDHVGC